MSSSKGCSDDTKRGLMANHINCNAACFPRYMRLNFTLLHAHMHRAISHRAVKLHINHAE